jgi:hypothetical protein
MTKISREIKSEDVKIQDIVKLLSEDKYLIPTFQREFVWQPGNIIKLWDSMFRFYPIGSLLYWETDSYLRTHRHIGGFNFPHDEEDVRKFKEWKYILDGQQRATSLLVSMQGGKGRVEDNIDFDYTLFFDATKGEFFFKEDFEKRKESVTDEQFLIRVSNVPLWDFDTPVALATKTKGYTSDIGHNIQLLTRMFSDYKIPVIEIKGVEVKEVCEIFERINQEGKRLDQFDILVAQTYQVDDPETGTGGFYLRDNVEHLQNILLERGSRFSEIESLTIMQMISLCLRKDSKETRSPYGITPASLNNLTADVLTKNWSIFEKTILETIKTLTDLKIWGPNMLPFAYLVLPICFYYHRNVKPDFELVRQWFWRTAFGLDEFRSSTDVYDFCDHFSKMHEQSNEAGIPPLVISRAKLIQSSYNYRNALSRAVLAFLANQTPLDFKSAHSVVLDGVYLDLSQAPNLHHIYPRNFLKDIGELPDGVSADSLMNICFIRQKTNLEISDRNPLDYFNDYKNVRDFEKILESHLIQNEFLSREPFKKLDYIEFLDARATWFAESLKAALPDVEVTITE